MADSEEELEISSPRKSPRKKCAPKYFDDSDDMEVENEQPTVRKGQRIRKSTRRFNSSLEQNRKELEEEEYEQEQDTDEEEDKDFICEDMPIQDTVSNDVQLPGKDIFTFDKKKKIQRLVTPEKAKKGKSCIPKTPHHVRNKIGKGIKATMNEDLSSEDDPFQESGSEYSGSQSDDSSSEDDSEEAAEADSDNSEPQTTVKPVKRTATKQTQNKNSKYMFKSEEYFANNATKKTTTSNHTLAKLKTPRLNQEQLQKLLSKLKISDHHQAPIVKFSEDAKDNFNKWICLLHENFNLLVYGLGSKKNLLNQFHKEVLHSLPVIVINGFFPSLTLKDILDSILVEMLQVTESHPNPYEACDKIASTMQAIPNQHLYIIVHNIDGDMLRNHKCQSVLAKLSSVRNIHLIGSIDHINAPLLWDHNKLSKFNFIWWDVTSFLPYSDETSFESSMMVQRTGNLALSSLRNIFLSLTSNSKGIYMMILKYQLENNANQYYQGLLFKDLYSLCREAFLVSSDLALRAQLTEFIDHKMVKLKRSTDGAEYLIIPIANNLLQQFSAEQSK